MIYEMYISGLRSRDQNAWHNEHYGDKSPLIDDWAAIAEVLKNTSHTFLLMPGPGQHATLEAAIKKYGLAEYTLFQMPYRVSNPVHHPTERRISLTILKGKGNEV